MTINIFDVQEGDFITVRAKVEYAAGRGEINPTVGVRSGAGTISFITAGDISSHEPSFAKGERVVAPGQGPGEILTIRDTAAAILYDDGTLGWCVTSRLSREPAVVPAAPVTADELDAALTKAGIVPQAAE